MPYMVLSIFVQPFSGVSLG